jgi:hypothetical protein
MTPAKLLQDLPQQVHDRRVAIMVDERLAFPAAQEAIDRRQMDGERFASLRQHLTEPDRDYSRLERIPIGWNPSLIGHPHPAAENGERSLRPPDLIYGIHTFFSVQPCLMAWN